MAKKTVKKVAKKTGGNSASSSDFSKLDNLAHLQPNVKADGHRKVSKAAKDDQISVAFAKANSASDIAGIASKFGIPDGFITQAAEKAPNFGQFGMVMRNAVRGVVNRLERAKAVGEKMTVQEAALASRAIRRFVKGGAAPAKTRDESTKVPAKTAKKAVKKTTKKVSRKK